MPTCCIQCSAHVRQGCTHQSRAFVLLSAGALQLCLQAGAILLISYEFIHSMAARWRFRKMTRRVAPAANAGTSPDDSGSQQANMQNVYVDQATGQQFMLVAQKPGWAADTEGKSNNLNAIHEMELQSVDGSVITPQRQVAGLISSTNGSA